MHLRRICLFYVNRNMPKTCKQVGDMLDYSKNLKRFDSWSLSPNCIEESFTNDEFIDEMIDMLVTNDENCILSSLNQWNSNVLQNIERLWKSEVIQHTLSK